MHVMDNNQRNLHLQPGQKTGFVLLLVFCLLAIGLGLLQLRNTIYTPFVFRPPETPVTDQVSLLESETVRLQAIDTDQDGLNNYEELYFYQTSPYLQDTDSDGLGDKQEIDAGQDPLCPVGENCEAGIANANASASSTTQIGASPIQQGPDAIGLLGQVNSQISQGQDADVLSLVNDPDSIRELIRQTGKFSDAQLDQISDEELLALVQKLLEEQSGTATPASSTVQEVSVSSTPQ